MQRELEHCVSTAFPKASNVAIQSKNDKSREQAVHFYWYLIFSQFIAKEIAKITAKNKLVSNYHAKQSCFFCSCNFVLVKLSTKPKIKKCRNIKGFL